MTRRAAELDARRRHLDQEREALVARRAELAQANNLQQRITDFAERALAGLDGLDFSGRQQLLRLVLDDVRVQGWQVELRLRIPLDDEEPHAGDGGACRQLAPNRQEKPLIAASQPAKEGVSSNDRLRSTGAERKAGFCTSRVIDAHPAGIDRRPGPAPGHGGRPPKSGRRA